MGDLKDHYTKSGETRGRDDQSFFGARAKIAGPCFQSCTSQLQAASPLAESWVQSVSKVLGQMPQNL
jgi:hypothetical protein